ncbi:MAG: thiamine-phosphate kinase [Bacteroidia bacterium]
MLEEKSRTELSTLGEFGLIEHLVSFFENKQPSTLKGVGDDAAVIKDGASCKLVSTDMLLEGIHFDLSFHPLKHLGYKAVAINVSDISAMNGTAKQILVSIGVSSKFSLEAVEEIYSGIKSACDNYNVDLIGGDTCSSKQGLVLSLTVIGEAEEKNIVYRSGAGEGDLLCVTGDLGGAYMGLQLLEREKKLFLENPQLQPDLEGHDYIVGRQLKPEARTDIIEWFATNEIKPTSMIDISDGLSSEIFHLCSNSKTGMALYEEKIPIDPTTYAMAREFDLDPTMTALNGGEDYELLFTIKQSDYEKVKNSQDITVIGHCLAAQEGIYMISKNGNKHDLKAQGWKAF